VRSGMRATAPAKCILKNRIFGPARHHSYFERRWQVVHVSPRLVRAPEVRRVEVASLVRAHGGDERVGEVVLVREERELVLAELAVAPRGVQIREEAAYKGNDERVERDTDDLDYHSVDLLHERVGAIVAVAHRRERRDGEVEARRVEVAVGVAGVTEAQAADLVPRALADRKPGVIGIVARLAQKTFHVSDPTRRLAAEQRPSAREDVADDHEHEQQPGGLEERGRQAGAARGPLDGVAELPRLGQLREFEDLDESREPRDLRTAPRVHHELEGDRRDEVDDEERREVVPHNFSVVEDEDLADRVLVRGEETQNEVDGEIAEDENLDGREHLEVVDERLCR